MIQSKIIVITGGIGSGKSTLTKYLKQKGYSVIDFDEISKNIYKKNSATYKKVISVFGNEILNKEKLIDRKKLANKVFSDSKLLKKLNCITHNSIYMKAAEEINKLKKKRNLIFLDIPLFFETKKYISKYNINIEEIWLIYVDLETQIKRVCKRDNLQRVEALKRISSQMDINDKISKADRIIDNTKYPGLMLKTIDRILLEIEESKNEKKEEEKKQF